MGIWCCNFQKEFKITIWGSKPTRKLITNVEIFFPSVFWFALNFSEPFSLSTGENFQARTAISLTQTHNFPQNFRNFSTISGVLNKKKVLPLRTALQTSTKGIDSKKTWIREGWRRGMKKGWRRDGQGWYLGQGVARTLHGCNMSAPTWHSIERTDVFHAPHCHNSPKW